MRGTRETQQQASLENASVKGPSVKIHFFFDPINLGLIMRSLGDCIQFDQTILTHTDGTRNQIRVPHNNGAEATHRSQTGRLVSWDGSTPHRPVALGATGRRRAVDANSAGSCQCRCHKRHRIRVQWQRLPACDGRCSVAFFSFDHGPNWFTCR